VTVIVLGVIWTHLAFENTAAESPNMATELEQLRQEAEQLKVQIRVGRQAAGDITDKN